VESVLNSINKQALKQARITEIKAELINSEKLKKHFEENPNDLQVLKHDKTLQHKKIVRHLRHVPFYLLPKEKEAPITPAQKTERKPFKRDRKLKPNKRKNG